MFRSRVEQNLIRGSLGASADGCNPYRGVDEEVPGIFVSRARGDARADSDYDIAVFLKSLPDHRGELRRRADLRVDFLDDTGAFFDMNPYPTTAYRDRTSLRHEIRRDGLDL